MVEITASLVKELREKTGAGMMDCKRALAETGGDLEASVDWLRKKGLAAAAKKAGRIAAEGLVGIMVQGAAGAIVEVNAETDFVARNATFQAFVANVARIALDQDGGIEQVAKAAYPGGGTVADRATSLIATIGENIGLRRCDRLSVGRGVVAGYVHNQVVPGMGKIGVLVALESVGDPARLAGLAKQLAMHVAAASPQALSIADVDPASLARERAILAEQAEASGKPPAVVAKMIEGRLRKYYQDVVLLEQTSVIDGETRVSAMVAAVGGELGTEIRVAGFRRYALGEGIARGRSDFAAEVAALGR